MMKAIPAVGVLIVENGKVLLVNHTEKSQHETGVYGLPAGRIEESETPKEAAVRELFEETGLTASEDDLYEYASNHFPYVEIKRKDGVKAFDFTVFVCRKYTGELDAKFETIPEWVDISKLNEYKLLPNLKEIVHREVGW